MISPKVSGPSGVLGGWIGWASLALVATTACSSPESTDDGHTTTSSPTTSETASETDSTTNDSSDAETSTQTDTSDATTDAVTSSGSFYATPEDDLFPSAFCDPWTQDCPEGEKCVPYASSGGTWDANKCVAILGSDPIGEPCTSDGPIAATDSCDEQGICWTTEPGNGESVGVCTSFCAGRPDSPSCRDGSTCVIANDGSINLCFDSCDPVAQDCGDGNGCYWAGSAFVCLPAVGEPLGADCALFNECSAGSLCVDGETAPNCAGSGCCTQLCSLAAPVCDTPGTSCVPFFDADPPAGFEDVGICI